MVDGESVQDDIAFLNTALVGEECRDVVEGASPSDGAFGRACCAGGEEDEARFVQVDVFVRGDEEGFGLETGLEDVRFYSD